MAAVTAVGRWRRLLMVSRLAARPPQNDCSSSSSASATYPGVVESTEEFKFVERLIPPTTVPVPPKHDRYPTPSGWCPPRDPPPDLPYIIRRSRMHNLPVYTDITHGNRKMTVIRKIEGDIWTLEKDVKDFLTQTWGKTPMTQVNEVTMILRVKGYFDKELKSWLLEKGF
ncbi:LOW QUALITY PROTEIN: 39S ribosomal protein L49, mitochondrial [Amblyraja radiata]|uniref:LOW QUALITY PROTEIN: 39S ribosomal protein L49, mitochondrial n=1 Tax=Amblyraja radiata TaxID=386614 RepID=UPI001401CCCA|nr:LOW QUALITY PROTEIN: 39S ribosomal protein L49, mitochondrial [Amblyraja radiata]